MNESFAYSLNEIEHAAEFVIKHAKHHVVAFFGQMGAGKTTLIKSICQLSGVVDTVASPTFSLVNEYQTHSQKTIYHFDFYRINDIQEVYDMGIEEYVYRGDLCLMEWPELIAEILADIPHTQVHIEQLDEWNRQLTITNQIA